jgi:hypothetical protein
VEVGSRAWGLSSPYSDYDVKFIYSHTPEWYLSIDEGRRELIDLKVDSDNLDINGWDIVKALKMLRESNCSILEWLLSPCIYMKHDSFHTRAIELVSEFTSRKTLVFHYINMAKKHRVEYFDGKENVDLKKYFFVIRPLLCVLWLKKNASLSTPPQDLEKLMSEVTVPVEAQKVLLNLIKQKREGNLSSSSPTDAILEPWIVELFTETEEYAKALPYLKLPATTPFNKLFSDVVLNKL